MLGGKSKKQEEQLGRRRVSNGDNLRVKRSQYYGASPSTPVRAVQQDRPRGKLPEPEGDSSPGLVSRLLGTLVFFAVVAGFLYSMVLSPNPIVAVSSVDYHSRQTYALSAAALMQGATDHTKLTINSRGLVSALQQQYPEITDASVSTTFFSRRPKLEIIVSKPILTLKDNGIVYIIDDEGRAVAKTDDTSADVVALPSVTDQSGFSTSVGKQVLTKQEIAFITTLSSQLQAKSIPVKQMTLTPNAEELHLTTSDKPYYAKFFMGGDVLEQTGAYLAVRQKLDEQHIQPSQYVDVRVDEKIYYK